MWNSMVGAACAAALLMTTGCSLPRGGAIEAEITRSADPETYAFYNVTADLLPALEAWPDVNSEVGEGWPRAEPGSPARRIAVGDRVNIQIWDSSDQSLLTAPAQRVANLGPMTVSSSGRVFVPYVGEVRIAGMSPDRARSAIQYQLDFVAPNSQVQLALEEGDLNAVEAVAGVQAPGVYPLTSQSVSVLSVISRAGGVAPGLNNPRVKLQRGATLYATSLDRLYESPSLDALMRAGDKLIVEADERYFLAVGATGREAVVDFDQDRVTALEAVAMMGGIADTRADPEGLLILREYPRSALATGARGPRREKVIFAIDLTTADGLFSARNMRIMPRDVVLATESPVSSIQVALSLFGGGLGFARQISQ